MYPKVTIRAPIVEKSALLYRLKNKAGIEVALSRAQLLSWMEVAGSGIDGKELVAEIPEWEAREKLLI
jgi:hypothetical protein